MKEEKRREKKKENICNCTACKKLLKPGNKIELNRLPCLQQVIYVHNIYAPYIPSELSDNTPEGIHLDHSDTQYTAPYVPSELSDNTPEGILPGIHLDHSDTRNDLVHDTHTLVCHSS